MIYLHTGVRGAESRMRWKQVDFKRRTVTVGRSKMPGGDGRGIPLNDEAFEILMEWHSVGSRAGAVFRRSGRRLCHKLCVRLRLVPASHDAEPDMNVTLFHERGNDGVERPLVAIQ
jgi:integrase